MNARMSFRGIMMAGLAVVALAATPAKAQDSTLLGAGAGAGGGAGIGFALGGPVGAVVGGLVGAGVGAGSGHLIGKEDKRNNARAPAAATVSGSDLTYQVQSELNAAGYNVGNPDGRNGPRTASAIRSYQANSGLVQDGQPSVPLLDHLRARRGVGSVGAAPAAAAPVAPPPPATAQPAGYTPAPALPTMPQAQPAAASQPADGIDRSNCKPYETRTTIDGREMVSKGTACLQKDGSWRTIN
ncbi:MAG: peptidoglycan-binding protein [Rhodospirillales bacterium]|nr:peptidoglycan-binding protein [Rhodospirillales bacterium]